MKNYNVHEWKKGVFLDPLFFYCNLYYIKLATVIFL